MVPTPAADRQARHRGHQASRTGSRGRLQLVLRLGVLVLAAMLWHPTVAQVPADPEQLLQEAERLAWLKAWTRAQPLYAEAQRLFTARGDRRNALFAEINHLRGALPRLAVPDVSQRLADYLEDPIVQTDDRLRLRCLVIKGETDEDLDPSLAEQSWREALTIAERLGDAPWANRARGELGFVAFMLGDISSGIIQVGQAIAVAKVNGDAPSQVRWLTLFGMGYTELGRPEQALDFYDQAFKAGASVPELRFPVMTHLARADALVKLERFTEADQLLTNALAVATRESAQGYQAELTLRQGLIAHQRKQPEHALELLGRAMDFARRSGGTRIVAEVSLQLAKIQRDLHRPKDAERTLTDGIRVARQMAEHLALPRLLSQLADLQASEQRYTEARSHFEEANDLLEGLFTKTSSPWVRSRLVGGMDEVFLARIRFEASHGNDASRAFAVVEQARGRSLLELLLATPVATIKTPPELRAHQRQLAALQLKLLRTTGRAERQRLLDQIFFAEGQLAAISTEMFNRTRTEPRTPLTMRDVQRALRPDELLVEFALDEPASFCLVVTRTTARVQRLAGRAAIEGRVAQLLKSVREGKAADLEARGAGELLLDRIPEIATRPRLVVSPDGDLHQLPFELLVTATGKTLLQTHTVSYAPSGSVLAILRDRRAQSTPVRTALAISASPTAEVSISSSARPVIGSSPRGLYDLDLAQLPPLPAANDEVRSVVGTLGSATSTVLLGDGATELEVKRAPLHDYTVLHFAVHGILSTKSPVRSALLLRPAGSEDGLLQAWEVLTLRLRAELVTLSACDTGAGARHGQDGVSSLVRPFLAAGARTVVANLWSADDQFSLALMRDFYRRLATGTDVADALRGAKLKMVDQFGPQALPKLWSGLLAYGDGTSVVARSTAPAKGMVKP
jgi:CHAT domain-containing protein